MLVMYSNDILQLQFYLHVKKEQQNMDEKSIAVATVVAAVDQARSRGPLSCSLEQPSVETGITAEHITSQNEQVVW